MGMKCVQCNTDNSLSDRTRNSGRCKQCNHPFVFEPTTITDKKFAFTDPFFKKAIEDISSQNMLFFTLKQFLYFIDKRLKYRGSLEPSGVGFFTTYFFTVLGSGVLLRFLLSSISFMLQIRRN
jgi:DNA-directed RNA polymerase subunit RPC12/RpoP